MVRTADQERRIAVGRFGSGASVMESWFSTVKQELGEHFESCGQAKMELFDYIEVFYNQRRRHSTLGQINPAEFERRRTTVAA